MNLISCEVEQSSRCAVAAGLKSWKCRKSSASASSAGKSGCFWLTSIFLFFSREFHCSLGADSRDFWVRKPMARLVFSLPTATVLFLFWLAVNFIGELPLLVILNYNTLYDTISSASWVFIKYHFIFSLKSISITTLESLTNYIYLLSLTAFIFLKRFNLRVIYKLFKGFKSITYPILFRLLFRLNDASILNVCSDLFMFQFKSDKFVSQYRLTAPKILKSFHTLS